MNESNTKKDLTIKRYGFYAYTKGLEHGLGLLVFDSSEEEVKGMKFHVGKVEKFSIPKQTFENLISYEFLEFIELLPKRVWKEYKKIYEQK